jgi:hypothetical protein
MKFISNLFKKITPIPDKDWSDVTIEQYYKIADLIKEQDEYTVYNLIDILWGIDSSKLLAKDLTKYTNRLQFLNKDVPKVTLKKHYTFNGRKYDSSCDLTSMSTAQFVDYNNYLKNCKYEEILSVFFIPEGHSYNDGYDILQVQNDLLQMKITDCMAAAFFFKRQLKVFCHLFQTYLIKKMKKEKMKKNLIDQFKKVDLYSLVSYPTSLLTVMQQMKNYQMPLNNQ